jgi:hypothetical protein
MNEKLRMFLEAAFPGEPWDDERVEAFRDATYACQEEPEEEESEPAAGGRTKAPGLAVIIGAGKPKKK